MSDTGETPAGWYPDPNDAGQQRYWDGSEWTDQTAPREGGVGGGAPNFPSAAGGQALPKVDTWLWQSILVTLVCCLPLGVVGIVFASQAQSAINVGNVAEAEQKARTAKLMSLIGGGIGLAVLVIYLIFVFAVGGAALTGL